MARPQAQARSATAGLRCLAALAGFFPAPALAGAWLAPEGGTEIWSNAAGQRDELSYFESSAYIEAPVGEDWGVVATPWLQQNYDTEDGWRGEATLGVKRVWAMEGGALALQAGALWWSHPEQGCSEGGIEVRALAGRDFDGGVFVNAEAAASTLEGGCSGERFDLTLGQHWGERWMGMAQVFVDGRTGQDYEQNTKLQLSLVHFGNDGGGLQLGLRVRVDGDDPEPALLLGVWGRPGD